MQESASHDAVDHTKGASVRQDGHGLSPTRGYRTRTGMSRRGRKNPARAIAPFWPEKLSGYPKIGSRSDFCWLDTEDGGSVPSRHGSVARNREAHLGPRTSA